MGVSVQTWRAAIGLFGQQRRSCSSKCSTSTDWNLLTFMPVTVIAILLVIGNVEMNPGPIPCKFQSCGIEAETIASSMRHQHYHANDRNFMYYCPSPDCSYVSKSYGALKFHVSQYHRPDRHVDVDPSEADNRLLCTVVGCSYVAKSFWELVQHISQHIDLSGNNSNVKCPIAECTHSAPFKKSSTFRVHLSQYHPGWRSEGCPPIRRREEGSGAHGEALEYGVGGDFHLGACTGDEDMEDLSEPDLLNEDLIRDNIAKFYLQLYAEFSLPFSTIQEICNGITFIVDKNHARMKRILQAELKSLGVDDLKVNEVCYKLSMADCFFTTHNKNAPGPSFTSDHLRRKYFKENFNFEEPIGVDLCDHRNTEHNLQYVPVTKTLSKILEDPIVERDVYESFCRYPSNSDEVSDYTDGSLFKEEIHDRREIHLLMYQDSFNPVMNALGSAKNKYKLLVMYFTIGNLKASNRSKIDSKHLVLLVKESTFKTLKAEKCFEKVLQELQLLEENGIPFNGEMVKVRVQFLLGDNLGQHTVGGFIESFSSTYFCRFCDIKRFVFKANPVQTNKLRSRQDFATCLYQSKLTEASCKGIKDDCVFNKLTNFHAVSHLPPCLAHDLFEGVVTWDLAGIIQSFVQKKWFSYKFLNRRIKHFKCTGIDAPNKPAYVQASGEKLGGHAIQNWTLLRLLLFIIGDKIKDFKDPAFQLYLQLKKLCEYFCAHSFSRSDVPYIRDVLLPLYFEQRSLVLLDADKYPLKPKHHFMVHYPELMLRYGPLIQLWTMGFQQKHKFFNHLCRLSRCFKNIEFTCAVRHQMNLSYLATGPLFPEGCSEVGPSTLSADSYPGRLNLFLSSNHLLGCRECSAVTIDGILYEKGSLLLLSANRNQVYFGFIRIIVCLNGNITFVLECGNALFKSEIGVYELPQDADGELKLILGKGLKYAQPQPIYDYKSKMYFSVKGNVL